MFSHGETRYYPREYFYKPPYHHQYRFADDQKEIIDRIDDGVFVASLPDEIDVPSVYVDRVV